MNGLKALYRLLELIPENAEDILQKADEIEEKIQTFQGKVVAHEEQATTWIKTEFDQAPAQLEDLISFFQKSLQNSTAYQKIKDQDLTPLVTLPDAANDQDLTALKINELKTFLAPLAIKDEDELFSAIEEIIHEISHPSNDAPTEPSLKNTYDHMNMTKLQAKVNVIIEKITGIPLASEANAIEASPEKVLEAFEEAAPLVEDHLKAFEQDVTLTGATTLAKKLEPILLKVISTLPLEESGIDPKDPVLTTIWGKFLSEVQQIDTSSVPNAIKSTLQTLAKVCEENLSADDALHDLSLIIQKLHLIVSYFIDNGLLVPLKVDWLSEDGSIPKDHGLNQEWQAVKAAQAHQNVPQPDSTNQAGVHAPAPTASSHTPTKTPTKEGFSTLLSKDQEQQSDSLLNGEVFAIPMAKMNEWLVQMMDSAKELPQEISQAWDKKEINNLDSLINWLVSKIKSFVNDLMTGLQALVAQLLQALGQAATMLLELLLNIKVPGTFVQKWAPSLSSLTSVNLSCLVLAVPWESFEKIRHLNPEEIKSWMDQ